MRDKIIRFSGEMASSGMLRNSAGRCAAWGSLLVLLATAQLAWSQIPPPARTPLGVYAKVSIEDALISFTKNNDPRGPHEQLRELFKDLLGNQAISGLTVAQHWDHISLSTPNPRPFGPRFLFDRYDWSYLDDAFEIANQYNATVQLIITPGFDAPQWVLARIPSCDPLLVDQPLSDGSCGTATFVGFPEHRRTDGNVLPLPWDPTYKSYWVQFLHDLNARYSANPAFVAIAVAGPTGASTEMIYPTSQNTSKIQPSGKPVDEVWTDLVNFAYPHHQNSNDAFVTAWKQALHDYENIFSGVTLIVSPDRGNDMPQVGPPTIDDPSDPLYSQDCSRNTMTPVSCETKVTILLDFLAALGPNRKAAQVGGMSASSAIAEGNMEVPGVKLLTSRITVPFPPILGGAEFDYPASGRNMERQGCPCYPATSCPTYPATCTNLTPELAAYNTLAVFFDQTMAQEYYNGKPAPKNPKSMNYLDVDFVDVQYANAPKNQCPASAPIIGSTSMQDLLNHAKSDLFAIAGVNVLPPRPTCTDPVRNR